MSQMQTLTWLGISKKAKRSIEEIISFILKHIPIPETGQSKHPKNVVITWQ